MSDSTERIIGYKIKTGTKSRTFQIRMPTEKIQILIKDLPDAESARRFYEKLAEEHPSVLKMLEKNDGLLSDVLTIAAFSPLRFPSPPSAS